MDSVSISCLETSSRLNRSITLKMFPHLIYAISWGLINACPGQATVRGGDEIVGQADCRVHVFRLPTAQLLPGYHYWN